jgi:hypothetical protein
MRVKKERVFPGFGVMCGVILSPQHHLLYLLSFPLITTPHPFSLAKYEVACMVACKVAKVENITPKAKWCLAILGADMEIGSTNQNPHNYGLY